MKQSQKLRAQFPAGLIAMMHLPGFGPKRARRLYDELGIDSLEKLRAAAEAQQLRGLRGFGAKAEEKLLETLAAGHDGTPAPRWLLSRALPIAEQLADALRAAPGADRVEVAGSLRRSADAVKDLDIVATTADPPALVAALTGHELVDTVAAVRRGRRARRAPRGHDRRPQDRRARPVRQRAPALHRREGAQRGAARGGRAARAARLASTGSSTTPPARRCAARPRSRSTSGSACRGSRPSCARGAASWRPRRRGRSPT